MNKLPMNKRPIIEYVPASIWELGVYVFQTDTIRINSRLPKHARDAVLIHENKHRDQYMSFSDFGKKAMWSNPIFIKRAEIVAHASVLKYCLYNGLWDSLSWTMRTITASCCRDIESSIICSKLWQRCYSALMRHLSQGYGIRLYDKVLVGV